MNVLIPGGWFLSLWMGLLWQYWSDRVRPSLDLGLTVLLCLIFGIADGAESLCAHRNDHKAGDLLIERLRRRWADICTALSVVSCHGGPPTNHTSDFTLGHRS